MCAVFALEIFFMPANAAGYSPDNYALLSQIGIPDEIIEIIPEIDKNDLIAAYLSDPNLVQVSNSTLEIDVLSQIAEFSNKTEDELLQSGYTQGQICQGKGIINAYNNTSDAELLGAGLNKDELSALRTALNGEISPYANISDTKLTFTLTCSDYSTSTSANYFIGVYFNWSSPYVWTTYTDKIALAWGGNLKQESVHQYVNYYDTLSLIEFTDFMGVGTPTYSEVAVNAMGIYTFPQGYSNVELGQPGCAKSGSIRLQLYQSGMSGTESKVIGYYAHQIVEFAGSISLDGASVSPAIEVGFGYDSCYDEVGIVY